MVWEKIKVLHVVIFALVYIIIIPHLFFSWDLGPHIHDTSHEIEPETRLSGNVFNSQKFFLSSGHCVVCSNNVGKDYQIIRMPESKTRLIYLSKFIQPFLWKLPKEVTPQTSLMRSYNGTLSENGSSARKPKWRSGLANLTTVWECTSGLMQAQASCQKFRWSR